MTEILKLIENDSRLTPEKIALMLDKEVGDIKNMIAKYERDGVILGYKTPVSYTHLRAHETRSMFPP